MANGKAPNKTWRYQLISWNGPVVTPDEYHEASYKELAKFGPKAVEKFRQAAPLGATGELRSKMTYRRSGSDGKTLEIVMPWYGRITIQGYAPERFPKRAKFLKIVLTGGGIIYRRKAGPIKANPWHLAAQNSLRREMQELAAASAMGMAKLLMRKAGKL
jgi:hypothetical protein